MKDRPDTPRAYHSLKALVSAEVALLTDDSLRVFQVVHVGKAKPVFVVTDSPEKAALATCCKVESIGMHDVLAAALAAVGDARNAVSLALLYEAQQSNGTIASRVGVSDEMVRQMRKRLEDVHVIPEASTRVGKDGRSQRVGLRKRPVPLSPETDERRHVATEAIRDGETYTISEFKRITGMGKRAWMNACRKGLRVARIGNRGYVSGSDWMAFLKKRPANKRS